MTPAQDSLRAVLDSVFATPPYDWVERATATAWTSRAWDGLVGWLDGLRQAYPVAYQALLLAMLIMLVAVFVHAGWTMVAAVRAAREGGERRSPGPGRPVRDARWYAERADRLATKGHYAEALQAAFQSLVLGWEARGLLRYDPSKTPREYLHEARLTSEDRRRLGTLVETLYRHAFGGVPCGHPEYRAWRRLAEERWHAPAT